MIQIIDQLGKTQEMNPLAMTREIISVSYDSKQSNR